MSCTRNTARFTLALALLVIAGCNVDPDIVGRATDAGLGLNDNDSGETPACETDSRLTPVSSSTECVYAVPLPLPPDFDWQLINVNVFQDDQVVPYAGGLYSLGDCEHVLQGWYWIDPGEYTQIGFCPQTCELASQWQALAFQFGCDTLRPSWFSKPPPRPRP